MNVLIIGLGSIGQRHLQNFKKTFKNKVSFNVLRIKNKQIVIKDNKIIKKRKFDEYYNTQNHKNLKKAFKAEPDLVLICNPSIFHEKYINLCIEKNINFFVEKPTLISSKKIKYFNQKIKKKGLITMVGFQQRFNPIIQDIKKIIDKKLLGPVINADFRWHTYLPDHHKYENYRKDYKKPHIPFFINPIGKHLSNFAKIHSLRPPTKLPAQINRFYSNRFGRSQQSIVLIIYRPIY